MLPLLRGLRLALGWLDLILATTGLWLLSWLPARWTAGWYPKLFWCWCRIFVRALDVDLRLHQHNARSLPGHYLMIANHPSAFEDIGLPALFPIYSLAKAEVGGWWLVGRIASSARSLYVHRESRESRRDAAAEIEARLLAGDTVALYPEGGCKGRRIAPTFKYGAFDISRRTGVPIVPVFIYYEAQEIFEWKPHETLVRKIRQFMAASNRTAHYYVFDAFDPAEYTDTPAYCEAVHRQYLAWQQRFLE